MLLSIAIPAYGRPDTLRFALERFIEQICGRYEADIEIIVADDATPNHSLAFVETLSRDYTFIRYVRYPENIGLERNLIACANEARGEYLWIFGDDDFLEHDDSLDEVMHRLQTNQHDMLVLNRTRRSTDLETLISENWMDLDEEDQEFRGLREFCLKFGLISVVGFITVNIFRRTAFQDIDASKYFGTMYPQLGAMIAAFHDRPLCLVARPLVCHRTQTQEEKRIALGDKASEADFMADARRRNALYFSHPFIAMLDDLVARNALTRADIADIQENTVIKGNLSRFLLQCLEYSLDYSDRFDADTWRQSLRFMINLPLSLEETALLREVIINAPQDAMESPMEKNAPARETQPSDSLSISVVTPSYNQGEFLRECICSVQNQTYKPIEHFVFDPGSTDDSRAIARSFDHVTLFEEPDEGQSDALNKGFTRTTGDIIAWLNSDDVFTDDSVFETVIERFNGPDAPDIVYGRGVYIDEEGAPLRDVYINKDPDSLPWRLQQEDGILQHCAIYATRSRRRNWPAYRLSALLHGLRILDSMRQSGRKIRVCR